MPIVEILGITLAAWGIPVILLQQIEFIRSGLAAPGEHGERAG